VIGVECPVGVGVTLKLKLVIDVAADASNEAELVADEADDSRARGVEKGAEVGRA
jgi:hypothetical protein